MHINNIVTICRYVKKNITFLKKIKNRLIFKEIDVNWYYRKIPPTCYTFWWKRGEVIVIFSLFPFDSWKRLNGLQWEKRMPERYSHIQTGQGSLKKPKRLPARFTDHRKLKMKIEKEKILKIFQ